mgnify:CR=1 FL=1
MKCESPKTITNVGTCGNWETKAACEACHGCFEDLREERNNGVAAIIVFLRRVADELWAYTKAMPESVVLVDGCEITWSAGEMRQAYKTASTEMHAVTRAIEEGRMESYQAFKKTKNIGGKS